MNRINKTDLNIVDIKTYVKNKKEQYKNIISTLNIFPKLVIIQVNKDEASNAYIKGKIKDLDLISARYLHVTLEESISEEELVSVINKYNEDNDVDGIIVQMPLPKHINEDTIKKSISIYKDVDGFNPSSPYYPCTPLGIINYLKDINLKFNGLNALVIGRSNIVGKPVARMLLDLNCNVTITHSKTSKEDLEYYLKHADIVIVAVGRKYLISSQEINKNAIIVDVGINRIDGKLYGDVEPNRDVLLQTPVPSGVGLLTRLALLSNLLECYKNRK